MAKKVMVLNGPNLNLLGKREPEVYGSTTLKDIENETKKLGDELGFEVTFLQSNHEGELVSNIQEAAKTCDALILNAAAYTHTSIAIHDALKSVKIPVVEVHLSNIFAREAFRHHSYVSPLAVGVICGFGKESYLLALKALANILK